MIKQILTQMQFRPIPHYCQRRYEVDIRIPQEAAPGGLVHGRDFTAQNKLRTTDGAARAAAVRNGRMGGRPRNVNSSDSKSVSDDSRRLTQSWHAILDGHTVRRSHDFGFIFVTLYFQARMARLLVYCSSASLLLVCSSARLLVSAAAAASSPPPPGELRGVLRNFVGGFCGVLRRRRSHEDQLSWLAWWYLRLIGDVQRVAARCIAGRRSPLQP